MYLGVNYPIFSFLLNQFFFPSPPERRGGRESTLFSCCFSCFSKGHLKDIFCFSAPTPPADGVSRRGERERAEGLSPVRERGTLSDKAHRSKNE